MCSQMTSGIDEWHICSQVTSGIECSQMGTKMHSYEYWKWTQIIVLSTSQHSTIRSGGQIQGLWECNYGRRDFDLGDKTSIRSDHGFVFTQCLCHQSTQHYMVVGLKACGAATMGGGTWILVTQPLVLSGHGLYVSSHIACATSRHSTIWWSGWRLVGLQLWEAGLGSWWRNLLCCQAMDFMCLHTLPVQPVHTALYGGRVEGLWGCNYGRRDLDLGDEISCVVRPWTLCVFTHCLCIVCHRTGMTTTTSPQPVKCPRFT